MTYRGPQCFSQKSDVAKLTFDLRKARAAAQPVKDLSTLTKSSRFRVLQCEDCERWRRVDERTFAAYQPDSWQKYLQEERRRTLLAAEPQLPGATQAWLLGRSEPDKIWTVQDVVAYGEECVRDAVFFKKFEVHLFDLFWFELQKHVRSRVVKHMDMVVRRSDFVNKKVELYDRLTSPALRCANLVATTCEDPCDWQAAFEVPHDLSDCGHLTSSSEPGMTFLTCVSVFLMNLLLGV